tara:strand:+ start:2075 stop:2377 length:303 start_codon:yes stop_codon:yes gene_type:complete
MAKKVRKLDLGNGLLDPNFFVMKIYDKDFEGLHIGDQGFIHFHIDDVVAWQDIPTHSSNDYRTLRVFLKGGLNVNTAHRQERYDTVLALLEERKCRSSEE